MAANIEAVLVRPEFSVSVRTNSHGYRDEEFLHEEIPGEVRIAGLGDSFAWGHGVQQQDSFYEVLERELIRAGRNVKVQNLAVSGYCQKQHLEQISLAKELGSDAVIIAFCPANDVLENGNIIRRSLNPDNSQRTQFAEGAGPHISQMRVSQTETSSHFIDFMLARFGMSTPNSDIGGAFWFTFDQMRMQPDARTTAAYDMTTSLLREIHRSCTESGMRLGIVIIPQLFQVSSELFAEAAKPSEFSAEELDPVKMNRFVQDLCKREVIPCIDLLNQFMAVKTPTQFFYPADRHLNSRGHAFVGRHLAPLALELID